MKIESLIKRKGGTKVPMGKREYHFKPVSDAADAAHVAEVENESHVDMFLSIREGYREYDPDAPADLDEDDGGEGDGKVAKTPEEQYPLAKLEVDKLNNKEIARIAADHLGIRGTARKTALDWATTNLKVDLEAEMPKAPFIDLVKEILRRVAKVEYEEYLALKQELLVNED